VVAGD
jgi:hypothetical protein